MKGLVAMEDMPGSLDLTDKTLPQVKDWKIGGKYKIIVEVEQTAMHKTDKGVHATFEVVSAKSAGESKAPDDKEPMPAPKSAKIAAMGDKAVKS